MDIKVFKDGNKWCALSGENLQEGVAGFGDSRIEAIKGLVSELEKETDYVVGLDPTKRV